MGAPPSNHGLAGCTKERSIPFMRKVLQNRSLERLEVVREALEDFEEANAHTALSRCSVAYTLFYVEVSNKQLWIAWVGLQHVTTYG